VLDNTPEQYQDALRQQFERVSHLGLHQADVSFFTDAGIAHDLIRTEAGLGHEDIYTSDINGNSQIRALIVGSSWERQLASDIDGDLLIASVPVVYRLLLGANYIGYRGGIRVIEDIYGGVLENFR
jgi:nitrogenase molybdenum-iron protein beta chain